jgi:hypothetical protein
VQWYGKCGGEVPTPEEIMDVDPWQLALTSTRIDRSFTYGQDILGKTTGPIGRAYAYYCPGCTHGVIHRLVAEVIDELGHSRAHGRHRTGGLCRPGLQLLQCRFQEAAHGRAPAMATGIKRVRPDLMVFTYQGDGDLASIGMGEIIHAANRGRSSPRSLSTTPSTA